MIYRETIWRDDRVAIVEVIPLAGQSIPMTFCRFHFRLSQQAILHSGPIIKSIDVGLKSQTVPEALDEAAGMREVQERKLSEELAKEMNRVMMEEMNAVSTAKPAMPKLEEEGKVSQK